MIVKADIKMLDQIVPLFDDAIKELKLLNINQWQNGYPNIESIKEDINSSNGYVYLKDNVVQGYCYLGFGIDDTYNRIDNGKWFTTKPYIVIHRLVVSKDNKRNNVAKSLLEYAINIAKEANLNIRVDTHKDNIKMNNWIKKNNFIYCGIIYVKDLSPRLAYELNIE